MSTRQGPCQHTWSEIKAGPQPEPPKTTRAHGQRLAHPHGSCIRGSERAGWRGGAKLQPRTGKLVWQGREDTGTRLRAVIWGHECEPVRMTPPQPCRGRLTSHRHRAPSPRQCGRGVTAIPSIRTKYLEYTDIYLYRFCPFSFSSSLPSLYFLTRHSANNPRLWSQPALSSSQAPTLTSYLLSSFEPQFSYFQNMELINHLSKPIRE